jgi:hypothetical protein
LNGFFPFQHRGREGSDTSFRVLLRSPLSCKSKTSLAACYSCAMWCYKRFVFGIYRADKCLIWLCSKVCE